MEKIFAAQDSWIEGSAVEQLRQTAALLGVQSVVGMPDLHPGKGCAVGTVCYTKEIVYRLSAQNPRLFRAPDESRFC
jgi:release factor H-coupled RctB family protein